MKFIRLTAIALFLGLASFASAKEFYDYDFNQEKMLCAEDGIFLISSFEDSDVITAHSYNGIPLWDRSFFAKIVSWRVIGDRIIVFSKHRSGYKTYLTCIDRFSGALLWQRP